MITVNEKYSFDTLLGSIKNPTKARKVTFRVAWFDGLGDSVLESMKTSSFNPTPTLLAANQILSDYGSNLVAIKVNYDSVDDSFIWFLESK